MQTYREKARSIIAAVIAAHIGANRKTIRKALRAAYPTYSNTTRRKGYAYKAWCDECAFALRERSRRITPRSTSRPLPPEAIIPSMRQWSAARGLTEVRFVLDIDLIPSRNPAVPAPQSFSLAP